jgi:hypothetical protein
MKKIIDEFTDLPVSHQRKSQLRNIRAGRCRNCGEPEFACGYCEFHYWENRLRNRERQRSEKPRIRQNKTTKPAPFNDDMIRRSGLPKDVMELVHDLAYHRHGRDVWGYVARAHEILRRSR